MKVRITNTQLHKLMVDHLNYLSNNAYENQFDSYIILYYSDEEEGFGDTDVIIEHDSYDGRLYIQKDYLNTFVKMFPLDSEDASEFIKEWFEWKYGVEVKYTES